MVGRSHRTVKGRKTSDSHGPRNLRSESVPHRILQLAAMLRGRQPDAEQLVLRYEQALGVAGSVEVLRDHLGEEAWECLQSQLPRWYTYADEPEGELDAAA